MADILAILHTWQFRFGFIALVFTLVVVAHEKNRKEREAKLERIARGQER